MPGGNEKNGGGIQIPLGRKFITRTVVALLLSLFGGLWSEFEALEKRHARLEHAFLYHVQGDSTTGPPVPMNYDKETGKHGDDRSLFRRILELVL